MGSLGSPMAIAKTKETFLPDLISGSSDALDEVKKSKPDPSAHPDRGPELELSIHLILNKAAKTLTVADFGVGMARSDLFRLIGAIASTGTNEFMEAKPEFIRLRFFPAFLVADKVVVTTKDKDDGQQYLFAWERGSFAVGLDADGERLHRGTKIKMVFKDEYLEEHRLEDLVSTYSALTSIAYPIYLFTDKAGGDGGATGGEQDEGVVREWERVQINKTGVVAPPLLYKVLVCVEGVPPHARRMETVVGLLGGFGLVEGLDGGALLEREKKAACVGAWVWAHDADAVATLARAGTLLIPEPRGPNPIWPSFVHSDSGLTGCPPCAAGPPRMLAYPVIIHSDRVYDYSACGGDGGGGGGGDLWPRCRVFSWDLGVLDGVTPRF